MALTRTVRLLRCAFDESGVLTEVTVGYDLTPPEDADNPGRPLPKEWNTMQVSESDLTAGNKTSITNIVTAMVDKLDAERPINPGPTP